MKILGIGHTDQRRAEGGYVFDEDILARLTDPERFLRTRGEISNGDIEKFICRMVAHRSKGVASDAKDHAAARDGSSRVVKITDVDVIFPRTVAGKQAHKAAAVGGGGYVSHRNVMNIKGFPFYPKLLFKAVPVGVCGQSDRAFLQDPT